MAGSCPEIESLDAFVYQTGEWMDWDVDAWNQQLLHYCFVRDSQRHPRDPIRASPLDLPLLVRDQCADPEELQALLARKALPLTA